MFSVSNTINQTAGANKIMSGITFDTLAYVKKLRQGGLSSDRSHAPAWEYSPGRSSVLNALCRHSSILTAMSTESRK